MVRVLCQHIVRSVATSLKIMHALRTCRPRAIQSRYGLLMHVLSTIRPRHRWFGPLVEIWGFFFWVFPLEDGHGTDQRPGQDSTASGRGCFYPISLRQYIPSWVLSNRNCRYGSRCIAVHLYDQHCGECLLSSHGLFWHFLHPCSSSIEPSCLLVQDQSHVDDLQARRLRTSQFCHWFAQCLSPTLKETGCRVHMGLVIFLQTKQHARASSNMLSTASEFSALASPSRRQGLKMMCCQ